MIEILKRRDRKKAIDLIYQAQQNEQLSFANFPIDYRKIKNYCHELKKKEYLIVFAYKIDKNILGILFLDSTDKALPHIIAMFVQSDEHYEPFIVELIAHLHGEFTMIDFSLSTKNIALIDTLNKLKGKANINLVKSEYVYYLSQPMNHQFESKIVLLNDADVTLRKKFLELPSFDPYWTPKRILASSDKRRVLLALEDDNIVALINATNDYCKTEEITNIFLLGEYKDTLIIYQLLWELFSYYQKETKIVFNWYHDKINQNSNLETTIERFGFVKETVNYHLSI